MRCASLSSMTENTLAPQNIAVGRVGVGVWPIFVVGVEIGFSPAKRCNHGFHMRGINEKLLLTSRLALSKPALREKTTSGFQGLHLGG